jgi:hypothetical protein
MNIETKTVIFELLLLLSIFALGFICAKWHNDTLIRNVEKQNLLTYEKVLNECRSRYHYNYMIKEGQLVEVKYE